MSSCLGLYIENNLIKYAKVTKERDLTKVEAFGVKFYDQIGPAINQIIAETFSYKTPISINLSEETYQYFYFFNLLNKADLKKAIETEFDSYCYDKSINRNALESRYALVPDMQDTERIKAIYISANKVEINRRLQDFEGNSISYVVPLPMAIANVADIKEKENSVIVNMEENTTITTILDSKIYSVEKIDEGMEIILNNINEKENSYAKSYEICKNTTIYTMEGKELLQEDENIYLEDIMPTLYQIVQKTKDLVDNSLNKIEKIYITGSGCVINNIDLYFQEYFPSAKCEILRPYFIPENIKINMKDYIEVNSAIALAMQGLGYGIKTVNFKKPALKDQLPDWMKIEIGKGKKDGAGNKKSNSKFNFSMDWKAKFDSTEKWLLRTSAGILSFILLYSAIATFLKVGTNSKLEEVKVVREDTTAQIQLANDDIQILNNKTTDYQQMTENLKNYSDEVQEKIKTKNVIPMLLTRVMNAIPKGVTITSIENTTSSHIIINAQSEDYDLLGFFKGSLIVDGILSPSTVVSTSGVKQNGIVKIVIEGDLP